MPLGTTISDRVYFVSLNYRVISKLGHQEAQPLFSAAGKHAVQQVCLLSASGRVKARKVHMDTGVFRHAHTRSK